MNNKTVSTKPLVDQPSAAPARKVVGATTGAGGAGGAAGLLLAFFITEKTEGAWPEEVVWAAVTVITAVVSAVGAGVAGYFTRARKGDR